MVIYKLLFRKDWIKMQKADFIEVQKHINILNVAYHLNLEITDTRGAEVKAICPFCRL